MADAFGLKIRVHTRCLSRYCNAKFQPDRSTFDTGLSQISGDLGPVPADPRYRGDFQSQGSDP